MGKLEALDIAKFTTLEAEEMKAVSGGRDIIHSWTMATITCYADTKGKSDDESSDGAGVDA